VVDCLVGAAVFAYQLPRLRAAVHPIYAGMGIVPEIATGMQAAAEAIRPDLASLVNLPEAHGCPTTELDDRITSCDVLIGEPL
jgi:hypothetical protein